MAFTTPTPDDLIEGVIVSISNDILPNLTNPKAQATAAMAQSVLQQVRQILPTYARYLAEEHNGMTAALRDAVGCIGKAPGPAADALRARGKDAGARPDLPAPVSLDDLREAHRTVTQVLVEAIRDIDELQRAGVEGADAALARIRAHLGPRTARDVQTYVVGAGMIGRG